MFAPRPLILTGLAVGHKQLVGLVFDKDKPFRACLLCGAVFQSEGDRSITNLSSTHEIAQAAIKRKVWADNHAKKHSDKEHEDLKRSGNSMTPIASYKLAAFGIISATDAVLSDEINRALYESNAIPQDDCESY